jgi:hypothetical protein
MAGNFSLLRQRKVTKREALNRTLPAACDEQRAKTTSQSLTRSEPLRSRRCPYHHLESTTTRALNVGCTPDSRVEVKRRSGGASAVCGAFTGKPGVQPASSGVKVRSLALVTGTAARAQRFASSHQQSFRSRARAPAPARWHAVQRLFFGDFLLAQQKKVTPPPGGTPGTVHRVERLFAEASETAAPHAAKPSATATAQHPGRA